jgi:CheY-like chemotaxis protein
VWRAQEMPVMDGLEATRRLRAMGVKAPIVALTANAMSEQQEEFLDAGADAVLTKPVEYKALVSMLASFGVERA